MLVLALKVLLAPALVTAATLAGRRWGAAVSGVVTALPLVAGPILAIIAIEHGRVFGATAARATLLGIVALSAFCVAFARAAEAGWRWPAALGIGWVAYGLVGAVVSRVDVAPGWGLAAALASLAAAALLIRAPPPGTAPAHPPPAWDLPARAGLTAALVLAVTGAAGALGPALSGVLTPFPIATSVLAAFTLAQNGAAAARGMLAGFVRALPGLALCFFVVALLL